MEAFDDAGVEEIADARRRRGDRASERRADRALAASERNYRELHDQAADAMIVFDRANVILDANEAAAALLGRPVDELRGDARRPSSFATAELAAEPLRTEELFARRRAPLRASVPAQGRRGDHGRVLVPRPRRTAACTRRCATSRCASATRSACARASAACTRSSQTQQQIAALELDPDAVTSTIVLRAQRLCGADGAAVQWFEGHESVFHYASGIAAPHVGLRLDRSTSLAGVAALSGEAVYSPDTENDHTRRPRGLRQARRSLADLRAAPPRRQGRGRPLDHEPRAERVRRARDRDGPPDGGVRERRDAQHRGARGAQPARRAAAHQGEVVRNMQTRSG